MKQDKQDAIYLNYKCTTTRCITHTGPRASSGRNKLIFNTRHDL